MSFDEETKKLARELFEEVEMLNGRIERDLLDNVHLAGIHFSALVAVGYARQLLAKIDPDYFTS